MSMRNRLRLATTLFLAVVTCLVPPFTAASAAPGFRDAPTSCAGTSSYPVTATAMIKVSTTTPYIGEKIKVSGQGFCVTETVRIYLNGHLKATAHTDASGSFDPEITVGGPAGDQTLAAIGSSGKSSDRDSVVLRVRAARAVEGTGIGGTAGGSAGGLSSTGTDIVLLAILAMLLLGGGSALTVIARRRRSVI